MTETNDNRLQRALEEWAAWHLAFLAVAADHDADMMDVAALVEDPSSLVAEQAYSNFGGLGWSTSQIAAALAAIEANRGRLTNLAQAYWVLHADAECLNPPLLHGHATP